MNVFSGMGPYGSIKVTPSALAETKERLFPESKHRSARIRKKLIRRFGGEYRMEPAAFKTPYGLIVHPFIYQQLVNEMGTAS